MTMNRCGGCGRDIDPAGLELGSKVLCQRCYHIQAVVEQGSRSGSPAALLAISIVALIVLALTGITLCVLYLFGTGNLLWFILLFVFILIAVIIPAVVLLKLRNITLLVTTFYLPLGIWSYMWFMAPGVDWQFIDSTAWGALFFMAVGFAALYVFMRDLRILPRL
jgi:hypothetical protein